MSDRPVDFGRRSEDYARHRPGYPAAFFERIAAYVDLPRANILDLATGPGTLAIDLAARGARVTGIDIADRQIIMARSVARERRLDHLCTFRVARAEQTGLPDSSFDAVTAGQCWHWLNPELTGGEVKRVLRSTGKLVIGFFDYVPTEDAIAAATEAIILKFNPTWPMAGRDGRRPWLAPQIRSIGFDILDEFTFDHKQPFSHNAWRGRMRTCNGVGSGELTDDQVEQFDAELGELLRHRFPDDPLHIRHRVWCLIATSAE